MTCTIKDKSGICKEEARCDSMARIGLLEDNSRIAKLCVTMLSYAGHDVTVYSNPQECLCALTLLTPRHGQHCLNYVGGEEAALPIDVLILDLHLPMMPGLEVLRRL